VPRAPVYWTTYIELGESKPSKLGISPGSKIIFNSIGASNGGYLVYLLNVILIYVCHNFILRNLNLYTSCQTNQMSFMVVEVEL
jgi:hypothetical protein